MLRRSALWMLLVVPACDRPDEDAVKQIVGAAVQDNFAGVREDQAELTAANAALKATIDGQSKALDGMAATIDALQSRVATLEASAAAPPPSKPVAGPRPPHYKVELGDAQTRGNDSALVTIVQFSDFQCPHCGRVGTTLDELANKYGDELRFAFVHYPLAFHDRAKPAAIAAEAAAEQDKFWEMHDTLFANHTDLSDANFVVWAKDLGLDVAQFKADLKDSAIEARVTAMRTAGDTLSIRGTPDFYVNGRHVESGNSVEVFSSLIDEELARARELVASGVNPTKVYATTIASGKVRLE